MLFSERSLLTMIHGVVLGGGALMALAAALFAMGVLLRPAPGSAPLGEDRTRAVAALMVVIATVLWVTVLTGTFIVFPPYRAAPPDGATELARYPRALLLSRTETAWLHEVAMEIKEHMPWISAMLATAVAFATVRYPRIVLGEPSIRRLATTLLAICFVLTSITAVLGTLVNKVAPLE